MTVTLAYDTAAAQLAFACDELRESLAADLRVRDLTAGAGDADVVVTAGEAVPDWVREAAGAPADVPSEGFRYEPVERGGDSVLAVVGGDATGAMYGVLDLAEQCRMRDGLANVEATASSPTVGFRAVKFNLPWSPYHGGEQADLQRGTCRDRDFWAAYLDQLARARFNALTLWNLHPFPFMVRLDDYPEACPFSESELAEWQSFWHDVFEMAAARGIDVYLVNWNIVVSPDFASAYDVAETDDRSELVRDYTRQSVRAVVEEYENLAGLGVSLCDWMDGMTPAEKQDWMADAILSGIADADREVDFLDRSVLTESIDEMRRGIDVAADTDNVGDIRVPTKFNWSHGHSTRRLELTHDYSSGEVDDSLWNPPPENYEVTWMIRNEDVFVLRWGDPDFVRDHVARNDAPYVGGYIVGSEVNTPAMDVAHRRDGHATWDYAFERQWLWYTLWGRLLYDPATPDAVFEAEMDRRYGDGVGTRLLDGFRHGSRMPLELAAFHESTWDYTLHAEGFISPVAKRHGEEMFISVDDLIEQAPLDSTYQSIPAFVADGPPAEGTSPLDLAAEMDDAADAALDAAASLRDDFETYPGAMNPEGHDRGYRGEPTHAEAHGALACEVADVTAWGHLCRYFATKLRGAVALERYRAEGDPADQRTAVSHLDAAAAHWDAVADVTDAHYRPIPYADDWWPGTTFSWAQFREDAAADVRIARRAQPRDDAAR
ncbi:MAG: hypothetical protein ABEJ68_04210 [Halobacteriaceae archaeon]